MEKVGFVKLLKEVGSEDLPAAGGKGANLGEMIRASLPVPDGFVLLVDSYREFVEANGLEKHIEKLLAGLAEGANESSDRAVSAEGAQILKETTEEIKSLFAVGKISERLREDIDHAYEALGRPEVAVRSSATAEDLPGASFAGQYSTYLNIRGEEELYEAVKKCWASLWNERAVSYRARQGIGSKDLAHGVVVQKLVDSEKSGIMFTANPVNGRRDQISLSSSWGLGEAVVSGEVEPDQWVIDKKSGRVISEYIAVKKVMTVRKEGGSELAGVEEHRQTGVTLNEAERNELLKLALDVEEYFGSPQDIEWAYEGGRFYLVQTRPITALFPVPEFRGDDDLRIYVNINMAWQAVKDPFTPFGIDLFEELTRDLVTRLSKGRPKKEELKLWWFHNLAGRMFADMTDLLKVERIQNRLRQKSVDPLDREPMTTKALVQVAEQYKDELMAGNREKPNLRKLIHPGLVGLMLKAVGKAMYGAFNPVKGREKALKMAEDTIANLEEQSRYLKTVEERLRFIENHTGSAFMGVTMGFAYGAASFRYMNRAKEILERYKLDPAELDLVGKALPYNVTTEMGMDLLKAAKNLDERRKRAAPGEEEVIAFLNKYGHKSSFELDVGTATWEEAPGYILDLLNFYIDNKDYDQRIERFYREQQEADEAIERITEKLKTAAGRRVARRAGKMLRAYRQLFGLREVPKFYGSKAFGIFRAVMVEAGEELAGEGRLEDKMDIFFLTREEIRTHHDLKSLVEQKKPEYFRDLNRPAPRVLTSTGESVYAVMDQVAENAYRGIAVSPGVYEGRVKILADPAEGDKLESGDILVTVATNPAWTPLFLRIGALVMETGGTMSHGSIVSREYGLPAVAGVANITTELEDGQKLRVNGETGIVEILD